MVLSGRLYAEICSDWLRVHQPWCILAIFFSNRGKKKDALHQTN